MRKRTTVLGLAAALLLTGGVFAAAADAGTTHTLQLPRPAWLTDDLEARIVATGPQGVEIRLGPAAGGNLNVGCLGTAPPYAGASGASVAAVSAGTCMVYPVGCTMNFVFTDGSSYYIGTAGHCASSGETVIAQIATRVDPTDTVFVTLAAIGPVVSSWSQGIGKDFALVKIDSGLNVVPGVAGGLGPTGVFCGDPAGQPVMHYGHGYIFLAEQGYPKFGRVIPKFASSYGYDWIGYALGGDSGSGVMNGERLAVGDLTHAVGFAGLPAPGLSSGTDMRGIFDLIGPSYELVTADGRWVDCAHPLGMDELEQEREHVYGRVPAFTSS